MLLLPSGVVEFAVPLLVLPVQTSSGTAKKLSPVRPLGLDSLSQVPS